MANADGGGGGGGLNGLIIISRNSVLLIGQFVLRLPRLFAQNVRLISADSRQLLLQIYKAKANFGLNILIHKLPYQLVNFQIEQNITVAVRSSENEGFVRALAMVNFVTTVATFFCGIGICRQIWKRGETADIKAYSFLLGVWGSSYWFTYGVLLQHPLIQYVNACQFVIYSAYTAFFWTMSREKCLISFQILCVFLLIALLFALLQFIGCFLVTPFLRTSPLGIVCACLNVASYAAPLSMLVLPSIVHSQIIPSKKSLLRHRNTSMLPFAALCRHFSHRH
ncbi:hypothetical protein niasHT_026130 [Heterodera trifolii]|uniref:Sugar transporter SWEET n=1 Tax=Heterodera trifolii TaxID=157864 RepID=A0ABD2KR14_9BILA